MTEPQILDITTAVVEAVDRSPLGLRVENRVELTQIVERAIRRGAGQALPPGKRAVTIILDTPADGSNLSFVQQRIELWARVLGEILP